MPQNSDTAKELEREVERFISLTLKDIGTKIGEEFDRNFEREAFFNEHWARRKYNDDESRGAVDAYRGLTQEYQDGDYGT